MARAVCICIYIYMFEGKPPTVRPFFFFFVPLPTFNKLAINGGPFNNGNIKHQGALSREKFDGRNDRPRGQISEAKNALIIKRNIKEKIS